MTKYKNGDETIQDVYHPDMLRQNTYNYLRDFIETITPEGVTILDVGCGTGYLSKILNNRKFIGVTYRKSEVDYCNSQGIPVIFGDIVNLEHVESQDVVLCVLTLEYITSQDKAIEQLVKTTKKDGALIIVYDCHPNTSTNVGKDYFSILTEAGIEKLLRAYGMKVTYRESLETERSRLGAVMFVARHVN